MKKLFIVETTNGEYWECNHGFHLVEAETKALAIETTKKVITSKTVVDAKSVTEFMRSGSNSIKDGKIKTIIGSSTM
jgi:hypothetical protein